jgi:hypothetical protein
LGRNRPLPALARRRFRLRGSLCKCAAVGHAKQDSNGSWPSDFGIKQRFPQILFCPSRRGRSSSA